MLIKKAVIFQGMSWDFVNQVYLIAEKESHKEGAYLFRDGDRAAHFYVLLEGRVRLSIGEIGKVVHLVTKPGEAFGWSGLVGRDVYSAAAKCVVDTKLLKIEVEEFNNLLEGDPANGLVLFKGLAATLGERLVSSYRSFLATQPSETHRTYGDSLSVEQTGSESSEIED